VKRLPLHDGQEIIVDNMEWLQTAKEEAIKERMDDLFTDGILLVAGSTPFELSDNGDDTFTVGIGVAYKSGERIEISSLVTYDADNPDETTSDGLSSTTPTPKSTGSQSIPITDGATKYIGIKYLLYANSGTPTTPINYSLHPNTGKRFFYSWKDGYEIELADTKVALSSDCVYIGYATRAGAIIIFSIASQDALSLNSDTILTATINLVDGAVSTAKIADLAVSTAKIASTAVTTAKIAASAVGVTQIINDAVTADKIASNAVTAGKIVASAVTETKIAALSVTEGKIGDLAVTTGKIGIAAVTTIKLEDDAVTAAKLDETEEYTVAGLISTGHIKVTTAKRLYLHSDLDTYIVSNAVDTMSLYINNNESVQISTTSIEFDSTLDVKITATKKLYLNVGNTYIVSSLPTQIDFYVDGSQVFYMDKTVWGVGVASGAKLFLEPTGANYLNLSAANTISIFTGSVEAIKIDSVQDTTFYGNIQVQGDVITNTPNIHDVGDSVNYYDDVWAAGYPSVSKYSIKKDIEYYKGKLDYGCLPRLASYRYKTEDEKSIKRLGYILNDKNKEKFKQFPYIRMTEKNGYDATHNSVIAYLCELVKDLNGRVKELEGKDN